MIGILFLEREAHRVAFAVDLDLLGLDLNGLAAADGRHELAEHIEGGAGGDALEELLVKERRIGHDLDIVDGATVVEGDEFHLFVASFRADPSFGPNSLPRLALEQILDFRSLYGIHRFYLMLNRTNIRKNMQIVAVANKESDPSGPLSSWVCAYFLVRTGLISLGLIHQLQGRNLAELELHVADDAHLGALVGTDGDAVILSVLFSDVASFLDDLDAELFFGDDVAVELDTVGFTVASIFFWKSSKANVILPCSSRSAFLSWILSSSTFLRLSFSSSI